MMKFGQILLAVLFLCQGGCASRGNVELLESQLRRQEDQLYAMRLQLAEAESDLSLAQREVQTLRKQVADRGEIALLPEQARSLFRVEGIRVNKFLTGGLDRDGEPGDDLLNVVLTPYDEDGETVKIPGELEVEAIDLSAPRSSPPLGVWRYSSEEVAERWQSGLTSGFQFRMPWQIVPTSPDIVLHARLTLADGRQFGTSAEIRVNPMQSKLIDSQPAEPRTENAFQSIHAPQPTEPVPVIELTTPRNMSPDSSAKVPLEDSNSSQRKPPLFRSGSDGGKSEADTSEADTLFPAPPAPEADERAESFVPAPSPESTESDKSHIVGKPIVPEQDAFPERKTSLTPPSENNRSEKKTNTRQAFGVEITPSGLDEQIPFDAAEKPFAADGPPERYQRSDRTTD